MAAELSRDLGVKSRATQSRRDLLVGLAIAAGSAAVVATVLLLIGRGNSEPNGPQSVPAALSRAPDRAVAQDDRPAPGAGPQQLYATRRAKSDQDAEAAAQSAQAPSPNEAASAPPPAEPAADSSESPPSTTSESDAPPNPRKLIKQARQQAQAGAIGDAIDTSRSIVSLLPRGSSRTNLSEKLDAAESAWRGGQMVDFDSLIELMRSTIAPNSWDSVGGSGSVQPFTGGVYVDTAGLLRPRDRRDADPDLARVRQNARAPTLPADVSQSSALRKISLTKLEREVARRLDAGLPLGDDIRYLAGLRQVKYLLVYPDDNDVVIAGPAEGWQVDALGRSVGRESGRPVMQLDDLVTVLRASFSASQANGVFGCSIDPRQERLQQVQEFVTKSAARGPIEPSQRDQWLAQLRDQLGPQDIQVFGVPTGSRVAHVMVEADYRMKLIGIGLEQAAVADIPSYFDLLGNPDPATLDGRMDVLRWWFTLAYDAIVGSPAADAFELRGPRVKVLSENELLTMTGQREHTGQSDPINAQFARNFSDRFRALAERDVNFDDLANIFDLTVVSGLIRSHNVPQAIDWSMRCFLDPDEYLALSQPAPRTVETVLNHRVYRGRHITAAVSGGVRVDPSKLVAVGSVQVDTSGELVKLRSSTRLPPRPDAPWWWD